MVNKEGGAGEEVGNLGCEASQKPRGSCSPRQGLSDSESCREAGVGRLGEHILLTLICWGLRDELGDQVTFGVSVKPELEYSFRGRGTQSQAS